MKAGPIIIVEDDIDDQEIFIQALREININNQVNHFKNGKTAFEYLLQTSERPFIIFCDVNLPGQKGTAFKKQIDDNKELRRKSIPFIFYSTSDDQGTVNEAYTEMTVQGFFKKQDDYSEIKSQLKVIVDYWMACRHPNTH
jgi:response regulator RpfG family c-di-GMP phosphodiesterase